MRLIGYERKKAFRKKSMLILIACFVLIDIFKIANVYYQKSYLVSTGRIWNKAYWDMYGEYKGKITDEKISNLSQRYKTLEKDVIEMTASREIDLKRYMTGTVYSDYNFLNRYYVTPFRNFVLYGDKAEKVCQRAKSAAEDANTVGNKQQYRENAMIYHIFEGRKIEKFSYLESMELFFDYSFSNILVLLLILYGLSAVYGSEREGSMELLLLTNKKGGKATQTAKLIGAGMFIVVVSIIFSVVDFLGFAFVAGKGCGLEMPLYAVSFLGRSSLNISVWQFCMLSMAVRALGFLVIGTIMLSVLRVCKNTLAAFGIGIAACAGAAFAYENCCHKSSVWLKIINPFSLVDNIHIFEKTEFVSVCGNPVLGWQAALAVGGICLLLITILMIALSKNNEYCR